jgi:hypothetical protein
MKLNQSDNLVALQVSFFIPQNACAGAPANPILLDSKADEK